MYDFMWYYDYHICLNEVCELYDAYVIEVYEVFTKRLDAWIQSKMFPFKFMFLQGVHT